MKTLNNLLATRPWVAYIDDERNEGNNWGPSPLGGNHALQAN